MLNGIYVFADVNIRRIKTKVSYSLSFASATLQEATNILVTAGLLPVCKFFFFRSSFIYCFCLAYVPRKSGRTGVHIENTGAKVLDRLPVRYNAMTEKREIEREREREREKERERERWIRWNFLFIGTETA